MLMRTVASNVLTSSLTAEDTVLTGVCLFVCLFVNRSTRHVEDGIFNKFT